MDELSKRLNAMPEDVVRALVSIGSESTSGTVIDELLQELHEAVETSKGPDLKQVADDLLCPVLSENPGPLSFQRLTQLSLEHRQVIGKRSFLSVIADKSMPDGLMQRLVDYAEVLAQPTMPDTTQHTGSVLYLIAYTALRRRGSDGLTPELADLTRKVITTMSGIPGFGDRVRADTNVRGD